MVRLLIEKGADVKKVDGNKASPLHAAASYGHEELIKYLISIGANVTIFIISNIDLIINGRINIFKGPSIYIFMR
jgi:ankyrin repeat protein